jgi:hypothetical protein
MMSRAGPFHELNRLLKYPGCCHREEPRDEAI